MRIKITSPSPICAETQRVVFRGFTYHKVMYWSRTEFIRRLIKVDVRRMIVYEHMNGVLEKL